MMPVVCGVSLRDPHFLNPAGGIAAGCLLFPTSRGAVRDAKNEGKRIFGADEGGRPGSAQ